MQSLRFVSFAVRSLLPKHFVPRQDMHQLQLKMQADLICSDVAQVRETDYQFQRAICRRYKLLPHHEFIGLF